MDPTTASGFSGPSVPVHGTKPTIPPMPPPGFYWVKVACAKFVFVEVSPEQASGSYHTWDNAPTHWEIIEVMPHYNNEVRAMGDDVGMQWDSKFECVVEVGPKIEEPQC